MHYPIPANWQSPRFNDTNWPRACECTDADIGATNLPACTRHPELFEGARWIWSANPVFINGDHVVIRWVFQFEFNDGTKIRMDELAYQRCEDDRTVEEKFYYDPRQLPPRN